MISVALCGSLSVWSRGRDSARRGGPLRSHRAHGARVEPQEPQDAAVDPGGHGDCPENDLGDLFLVIFSYFFGDFFEDF